MAGSSENNLDFKTIILRFWQYKWIFLFSIIVCVIFAYFHNKFSQTIYENSIQISIDIQERRSGGNRNERFQAVNFMNETSNLENELGKMNSFPLIKRTLTQLNYEVSYHLMESPFQIKPLQKLPYKVSRELYKRSPFEVNFYKSHDQLIETKFFITKLTDSTYQLKANGEEASLYNYIDNKIKNNVKNVKINKIYKFGEEVETEYYKFFVSLKDSGNIYNPSSKGIYFMFHHMDYLTLYYLNSLNIEPTTPTSSLIDITISGTNHQKVTEFLNQLAQVYINKDLEEKNREARSTIDFIEGQISDVASSLSYTGSTLERFRSQHQIVDLDFQGQMMYETLNSLENEQATILMQKKYYEQIRDYIQNNNLSELMAPSSMNVSDPILNNLISQLTELNSERTSNTPQNKKNVYLEDLNNRFENLKKTILENVNTSLKNIEISLDDIEYRINKISSDLSALPSTELKLQAIQRRFELNDEIYTYLLTKRAEAQIAQASNFPSYEIIDPARNLDFTIISPRTKLNIFLALLIGTLIPALVILIVDFFNTRVRSVSDIENLTNIPIIGNIAHSKKDINHIGVNDISYSLTSESIRMLRTNLQILHGNEEMERKVILITSSRSSEGKTFSSINLAKGFSFLDKKVVLVGYDLRKPKLAQVLDLQEDIGVSTYLTEEHEVGDIIQYTENYYLDIITEGPLPPNPTELIASSKTFELIEYLKSNYDYVIIDTSPVGIVPDSKLLMKYTDINLLLVRQTRTKKVELLNTLKGLNSSQVSKFFIVLNDFSPKNGQYNYMYRYYADEMLMKSK